MIYLIRAYGLLSDKDMEGIAPESFLSKILGEKKMTRIGIIRALKGRLISCEKENGKTFIARLIL